MTIVFLLPCFDYFINSIDFDCDAYIYSHELSRKLEIKEYFPFVIGERAVLIVIDKNSPSFIEFFKSKDPELLKIEILNYCISKMIDELSPSKAEKLRTCFAKYTDSKQFYESDPQCALGVHNLAGLLVEVISDDINDYGVKSFPEINIR